MKPTLVVMAAGMGSRFGGLKQIEPLGPNGEILLEYAVYDAIKAGFGKIVFIIKTEIEQVFKQKIGYKVEKAIDTEYVFQDRHPLPKGLSSMPNRKKPWGTAHAVLSSKDAVSTPFAVINSDDFYGASSFQSLSVFLNSKSYIPNNYCMVGYSLKNTITENGHVSRGVCEVDENNFVSSITELKKIAKFGEAAKYTLDGEHWIPLDSDATVSMNAWGFGTEIFPQLEEHFELFLQQSNTDLSTAEFYISTLVSTLIASSKVKLKVLPCHEKWYGVTYPGDKPFVTEAIAKMDYPGSLW